MKDEQHLERLLQNRVRCEVVRHAEHHLQEVPGIGQIVVGVGEAHADRVSVGERGEGRHFGNETMGLKRPRIGVTNVLRVRIERG